ncbi:MAG: winged helix-turn-helix transcriptional regulator, partial [Bacteroidales bacterium]|nr:winged helix-turn-helix transcriptional regulator [Bacteroidales bacterium]
MGHHQLDKLDEKILSMVSENARVPFLEIARACNVSGAAIHQRMQKLTNLGVIRGSEYIIDSEAIGLDTCAYIGLYLKDPESFEKVI